MLEPISHSYRNCEQCNRLYISSSTRLWDPSKVIPLRAAIVYKSDLLSQNTKYRGERKTSTTTSKYGAGFMPSWQSRRGGGHQKQRTATFSHLNMALNINTSCATQRGCMQWALRSPRGDSVKVQSTLLMDRSRPCFSSTME